MKHLLKHLFLTAIISALVTPFAAFGQTIVFNDTFANGSTLNAGLPAGGPTANSTDYDILSPKGDETSCTIKASDLTLKLNAATSSGYWEAEALFTTTPVTLVNTGDNITLLYVFTNTGGTLLGIGSSSFIFTGLYYSGSPQSPPTNGVNLNGGLTSGDTNFYTGAAANWEGYVARVSNGGNSYLDTRPVQNGATSSEYYADQDVVGDNLGGGSYDNPAGSQIGSTVTASAVLASGATYTESFSMTLTAAGTLAISNSIFSGVYNGLNTGATPIFTQTGTTTSALTTQFDALALGARSSGSPTLDPTMDISQITIFQASATAPSITGLVNQTVVAGNNATLSATVGGFPPPALTWSLSTDGGNTFNPIAGATGATLILTNVQYSQNNYQYSLAANNASGSVASTMTLTVTVPPSITGLNNQAVTAGNNVTISPTVSGVPAPACQWQTNGVNLHDGRDVNGSTISGSSTSTLIITDVQIADGKTYWLIASNSAGTASNSMLLTVTQGNFAPVITGLSNQTVLAGNNATLSATVSGNPTPALQWYLISTDGGITSNSIAGQTTSTLALTDVQYNQPSYRYTLFASNSVGVAASTMTLTVIVPPTITVQPVGTNVSAGSNAFFSVTATGVPAPSYLWYTNNVADPNGTSATYTITDAQVANGGTYYVVVSNAASSVTSDAVTLTVFPLGSPVWTGANSANDMNWSDGTNWVGGSGTAGVPGPSDNVSFFDYGATNNSQSQVDDIVDGTSGNFGGTIASLRYGNTNGYHTTQIANGLTLNVTGSNGLMVFTPGDPGLSTTLYAAITGANGTLNLNNTNANLVVNEGSGTATPTATLDMSGLGAFTANISRLGLSTANLPNSGSVNERLSGNLYLAATNTITLNYTQPATNYLVANTGNALEMSVNPGNGASPSTLYLGQQNVFYVDSIGVGRDKSTSGRYNATLEFNPNTGLTQPTAYFRGIGGSSGRVTWWGIGDMNNSGSSAQAACGLVDFSNGGNSDGSVDAMVGTMSLGRDGGGAASDAGQRNIGTLNFTIGTLNVNTLILGNQSLGPVGNLDPCVGLLNINAGNNPTATNAMLIVNDNLILGNTTVNSPAAQNTYGELTVDNGTVLANNISVGAYTLSGQNSISLTGSTLLVSNSLATTAPGLASLTLNSALLGLPVNANATPSAVVQTLNNGGGNLIQIMSVPVFPVYPTNIMLIQCVNNSSGISGLALAANEPPDAAGASLVLDADGQSIDIQLVQPLSVSSFGLSNGHFKLTVSGGSQGLNYEIQTSTNLITWITVSTNNSPTLPFQYVAPGLATNHALFYRVVAGSSLP